MEAVIHEPYQNGGQSWMFAPSREGPGKFQVSSSMSAISEASLASLGPFADLETSKMIAKDQQAQGLVGTLIGVAQQEQKGVDFHQLGLMCAML